MTKDIKYFFFTVFLILGTITTQAQVKAGQLVDGISAVVGNEIVLESDIQEQLTYAQQQGETVTDKCSFLEKIVGNKLLIYQAKKDTLIEDRSAAIRENTDNKYTQILSQFPDEKSMLAAYKFRTPFEMKNTIEKIDSDQYYGQAKYGRITEKADVTPNEVTDFYTLYQSQLPEVKDEVTLAEISLYPKLTAAHKQELIDKLKKIKADILGGETFENEARIYSEDPGSAKNGGLYKDISRGKMVKIFEATALNLQEGDISDPVESDFGFHIIQLVKKSGKQYDARHILLKAVPDTGEIAAAKKELDSIKVLITKGEITFKNAAFKFSDNKATKFSGGLISGQDGSDRLEKSTLAANIAYQIAGVNKGDMTDVFEDDLNEKKVVTLLKVEDVIGAHRLDIATDYNRIKDLALNRKKNDIIEKWINQEIPKTFISIDNRYDGCTYKSNYKKTAMKN
ncbi:peptidylprolyl isomerase [Halpernia frigidisoli]|uniref:Periplasmic chaperone for outer membrane proteins SurA n=1 Tax=Halpernia frigidisoli TaxID=1125876 RepID=A0A1I3ISN0_9FLAO|nr:peptidylprolyl isomerase [Halpernia frigidisoli]SFI50939.1 periplasmic chaperone for outer membrane proteins SurA [Halpernia frigidisoli]